MYVYIKLSVSMSQRLFIFARICFFLITMPFVQLKPCVVWYQITSVKLRNIMISKLKISV